MGSARWTESAFSNLNGLDPLVREHVLAKVSWLEENFSRIMPERLHRELSGLYKLRAGDYRIVYSIQRDRITIETVGHRRDVYR